MLKEIKIELTNKCARNCKHCSSNATNNIDNLKELDFDSIYKIITIYTKYPGSSNYKIFI